MTRSFVAIDPPDGVRERPVELQRSGRGRPDRVRATECVVYRSDRGAAGPVYTPLARLPLAD